MMKNYVTLYCLVVGLGVVIAQCPWQQDLPDFQSSCLCAYNLRRELSVQCDIVDFTKLVNTLDHYCRNIPLDLLYINNSTVLSLKDSIFKNLQIHNIQISGCRIRNVHPGAFVGQEDSLKNLNLQENDLTEVPVESLRQLKFLSLLDLSHNRITNVPDGSFRTLKKLTSLKLSDNNVTLTSQAFQGLENSLKNLNLKNTNQKNIPQAVRGMKNLAFLDMSQNNLRDLPSSDGNDFEGMVSLTALNLERNLLQSIEENAFEGVKHSLSSLSLLNNLIPEFPTEALSKLPELRVLDIGFNLLTELPNDAFTANPSLTLLAVDGNPLSTVPYEALSHLNHTLRGLSLGGRFLHCDCRLRWIIDWIQNADLQVTSRERNPQFCGSPPRFRDRGFYSIQPEELQCSEGIGVATVVNPNNEEILVDSGTYIPAPSSTTLQTTIETTTTTKKPRTTTKLIKSTTTTSTTTEEQKTVTTMSPSTTYHVKHTNPTSVTTTSPSWKLSIQNRPSLVMGLPSRKQQQTAESMDVMVKSAYRQDNSVIIQWGSNTANILGFRVVYRLFGDKTFKQGPPLEASEREFKIKNVPAQECIVVCVISLEEINVTPDTVPHNQCREVRTVTTSTSNMDKITIAASAAICGTIIIAVIVFVATSRRRSRKMHHDLQKQKLGPNCGHPITGLPINCCTSPTTSPGGPMSSFATLNAFNPHKEWDQMSAYSSHSIQRPQIYSMDQPPSIQNGLCSNFGGSKGNILRSMADGQSQHSFSNSSSRYLTGFSTNLVTQDFRQSRQSLAMQSDRMSRKSHPTSHHAMTHSTTSSTRRTRPRSRSRDQHHRAGSHYSTAGSIHTLNNYCEAQENNWTDHDMDIYMARNPTTHGGLVPL